ncbi:chemotaxis protein [Herbaspirillum aquaticum]|uniref:Chemotaxis protein n=1 Tax=Herbaspirillum aquaticum TaxID=568783 RepID=A0A225STV9_9BURK|nr:PAS domain-containing methyl-accepting chemotaxis protein [Herbaspirillum aquaticum]OWY34641.1 chemotaxis protein [Herbaspirillum aquaticum]
MRLNLPTSGQEYPFPSGQSLVSTTDVKGRILYCNAMFVDVSGYSKTELLGQPHNVIRHPDMPEEAFRDMWATISTGRPWSGLVKNRRKNGDHYWVVANVTPLLEDGVPAGYMSVRTEATRAQIESAEDLYATMRAEMQAGKVIHTLSAGRINKRGVLAGLSRMLRVGTSLKMLLALLLMVTMSSTLGWFLPDTSVGRAADVGIGVLMALLIWWYFKKDFLVPIGEFITAANRLAAGDLSQTIKTSRGGEIGQLQMALGQLSVNLKSIVGDARAQSQEMVRGAAEIASGNQDLSQRTEAQASNLEQTSASMEQITDTVRQAAGSAERASQLARDTSTMVERGSQAVGEMASTMSNIRESSARIGEIIQVIDGIAFQTNILALNAAVEAARAGEQGRGFAVVAGEVRTLAQRSATAAKEIRDLIEDSERKVAAGSVTVDLTRKTMADVVGSVGRVNSLVNDISKSAHDQLDSISQINAAVSQLDGLTQQNAALVEQIAASAMSLEGVARNTAETVHVFRVDSSPRNVVDAVQLRRLGKGK